MHKSKHFRQLLQRDEPLIICGVQNGLSARLAQRAGFEGLWASSLCISASKGLPDVGVISMSELLTVTAEINRATAIPVIADVDEGFGDAVNVVRMIREYEGAGIAGVCMEDARFPKRNSLYSGLNSSLEDCETFALKVMAAKDTQTDPEFVVIARTEALVAGLGIEAALRRATAYAEAGADLVLIHSKSASADEVLECGRRWCGIVPLAAVPTTYNDVKIETLHECGYKLVIFANQGLRAATAAMDKAFQTMVSSHSLVEIENTISPLSDVFSIVDYEEVRRINARYIDVGGDNEETLHEQLLFNNPAIHKDSPALKTESVELSYGDLETAVRTVADHLHRLGIKNGDRAALLIKNSPEFVIGFLGIVSLGAIVVPIDHNAGADRIDVILKDTTPGLCLCRVDEAPAMLSAVPLSTLCVDPKTAKVSLSTLSRLGDERLTDLPKITENNDAAIFYSAGSTGRPKGVVLKHRHFLAIARTLSRVIGMNPDHRDLILSPMTHSGGWQRVSSTFLSGGCVVIAEGILSVPALLDDIRRFGVSGFFTTPPFLRAILRTPLEKFRDLPSGFRSIEIASAPVTSDELKKLNEIFPNVDVYLQYGLTECSRAIILDASRFPNKLHTIGKPTNGVKVAIADSDGSLIESGKEGEILLKAKQCTEHYWNLPGLNTERFNSGWLRTGDYGLIDEDGFVIYRGREDDMINCGGLSFFPAEVELVLGVVDEIKEYLIAGVPDPQKLLNQVAWAFVVPHNPERWSAKPFLDHARRRLPAHMVPRNVVAISEIPQTRSGKPDRRATVKRYGPKE